MKEPKMDKDILDELIKIRIYQEQSRSWNIIGHVLTILAVMLMILRITTI